MELKHKFYDKYSMILVLALAFIALPGFTFAQSDTERDENAENYTANGESPNSASRHSGGVLVVMGDGSVRFLANSANGDSNKAAPVQIVEASRIYLPNSPLAFDFVDANDPNAENKARALFNAANRLRRGIVITFAEGTPDVSGVIPTVDFFVSDGTDENVLAIELKECLITSYQVGGNQAAPSETHTLNFGEIKFTQTPKK